jgi:hypothetical protein
MCTVDCMWVVGWLGGGGGECMQGRWAGLAKPRVVQARWSKWLGRFGDVGAVLRFDETGRHGRRFNNVIWRARTTPHHTTPRHTTLPLRPPTQCDSSPSSSLFVSVSTLAQIEKSSYGSGYVPPKKAEEVSPSRAELRAAFVPTTDVSEVSSKSLDATFPSQHAVATR